MFREYCIFALTFLAARSMLQRVRWCARKVLKFTARSSPRRGKENHSPAKIIHRAYLPIRPILSNGGGRVSRSRPLLVFDFPPLLPSRSPSVGQYDKSAGNKTPTRPRCRSSFLAFSPVLCPCSSFSSRAAARLAPPPFRPVSPLLSLSSSLPHSLALPPPSAFSLSFFYKTTASMRVREQPVWIAPGGPTANNKL